MKKYSSELPTLADDKNHSKRVEEITKRAKSDTDSQRQRFEDVARDLGCDENEAAFEERLKQVASSPPPKPGKKRQSHKSGKK